MVIWLIGLSGAGKTTIGRHLHEMWKGQAANTVFVDGDEIRELFKQNQRPDAYTIKGRRLNAERITSVCAWLDGQGINVVCCVLSLFPEMRKRNRTLFSRYFEVYISVPMDTLRRR
ncbi:MAG: adenylyl-sulfate kinase, partial [Rhodospirillales bacterium]